MHVLRCYSCSDRFNHESCGKGDVLVGIFTASLEESHECFLHGINSLSLIAFFKSSNTF